MASEVAMNPRREDNIRFHFDIIYFNFLARREIYIEVLKRLSKDGHQTA